MDPIPASTLTLCCALTPNGAAQVARLGRSLGLRTRASWPRAGLVSAVADALARDAADARRERERAQRRGRW